MSRAEPCDDGFPLRLYMSEAVQAGGWPAILIPPRLHPARATSPPLAHYCARTLALQRMHTVDEFEMARIM